MLQPGIKCSRSPLLGTQGPLAQKDDKCPEPGAPIAQKDDKCRKSAPVSGTPCGPAIQRLATPWESLQDRPKIPFIMGLDGCRPHLVPLIRTFNPFYREFAVHDTPDYPGHIANSRFIGFFTLLMF